MTPSRKRIVNSLGRKSYQAAARAITSADSTKCHVLSSIAQQIRHEMSDICSLQNSSLLRNSYAGIKNFSWKALSSEFYARVPTMMSLLKSILPKSDEKFLLFLVSLVLKKRCKHLSLVQRVISIFLYGYAANRQVSLFAFDNNVLFVCIPLDRFITVCSVLWCACHLE